jgi:hypothetical protein
MLQTELLAVVQLTWPVQFAMPVHASQVSAGPLSSSQKPVAHWVHCEVVAEAQVSGEVQ